MAHYDYLNMDYSALPELLQGGARRYIEMGIPPGDFLTAVICNDLREACGRADDNNKRLIFEIVLWFYNEAPGACWGSKENMERWIQARRPSES